MESVKCPYCEEYVAIYPEERDHCEDKEIYECPNCSKNFEVLAELILKYSVVGKADCLNGANHKWEPQFGVPKIHFRGKYICEDCSATKQVKEELATKEEWREYYTKGCEE